MTRLRSALAWLRQPAGWLRQPVHAISGAIAVLAIALVVQLVVVNSSDTPWMDEWENSALIATRTANGTLTAADLFRQNFDHRLLTTNLITAALTVFTGWNLQIGVLLNVIVVGLTFALLLALAASYGRAFGQRGIVGWVMIPFALLIFTLRQRSIWLWGGLLLSLTLISLLLIAALLWIQRRPVGWGGVIGAAIAAVGMSYSMLQGFFAWPCLLIALLLRGYRRPAHLIAFAVIGGATVGVYLIGYDFSLLGANEQGNSAGLVREPLRVLLYLLAYLGNPFVPMNGAYNWIATAFGIAGLSLAALNGYHAWRKHGAAALAVPLALIAFAVGSGILTALGRALLYPERIPVQPLLDRYTPPPSLLWIAIVLLAALALRGRSLPRPAGLINGLVLAAALTGYLWTIRFTPPIGPWIAPDDRACVLAFPVERDFACMGGLYLSSTPETVLSERISQAAIHQLALFGGQAPLYSQVMPLYTFAWTALGDTPALYDLVQLPDGRIVLALAQPPGTSAEFTLTVPAGDEADRSVLASALAIAAPEAVTVGAEIVLPDGTIAPLFRETLPPSAAPVLALDLSAVRGQPIRLRLFTERADAAADSIVYWVDPRLEVRPAAAR